MCEHELHVDVVTLCEEAAAPPPLERVATRATGCRVILKPSAWSARDDARRPVVMENVGLSQAVALRARALLGPEDAERFVGIDGDMKEILKRGQEVQSAKDFCSESGIYQKLEKTRCSPLIQCVLRLLLHFD